MTEQDERLLTVKEINGALKDNTNEFVWLEKVLQAQLAKAEPLIWAETLKEVGEYCQREIDALNNQKRIAVDDEKAIYVASIEINTLQRVLNKLTWLMPSVVLPYTEWLSPRLARWTFILAIIGVIIGGAMWLRGKATQDFVNNRLGNNKKIHFTQNDAWTLYEQFNESIRQIRKVAKERLSEGKLGHSFFEDERYLAIMDKITKDREHCTYPELNKLLNTLLRYALHCAEFGFSPMESRYAEMLENYHQRIRDYINKHIRE